MVDRPPTLLRRIIRRTGFELTRVDRPLSSFRAASYLRHNARRLEHLASLGLDVAGKAVLEVGAGIGDHSHYYEDRGCRLSITEAREENLRHLRHRFPRQDVRALDLEAPGEVGGPFEVVHCYGLLYHLSDPGRALGALARACSGMLLLETCVSFGATGEVPIVVENRSDPTQAASGSGCRPTRRWVFDRLSGLFPHVYTPTTQPNHEEFPLDWTDPEAQAGRPSRAVFVASRRPIANEILSPALLDLQVRHP